MFSASPDIRERDPQTVSIRTATVADFDFIAKLYDEGLGRPDDEEGLIEQENNIKNILTQSEVDAKEGKRLLSFISYVGDKPAGCVLLTRLDSEKLKELVEERIAGREGTLSSREIEKMRRQTEEAYAYQAGISAFIIAKEFQTNPEVLLTMSRHLLEIRENGKQFTFFASPKEGTMYRIAKSKRLQERIRGLGYSVEDVSDHDPSGNDSPERFIVLHPIRSREKPWRQRALTPFKRIVQK